MSVQSTNLIANGATQSSGFVASPSAATRQVTSSDMVLAKTEVKLTGSATPEALQHAVDGANKVLQQTHSDIQFVVDSESNKVVIKLIEPSSGEVLNQYPTEQALAISNAITQVQQEAASRHAAFKSSSNGLQGLLFKQKT